MVEVCNSVQAAVTKLIQEKNKLKEAKWLSDDTLQIAEERREGKSKGERKHNWMQVKKQQLEQDKKKNGLVPNWGRST